MRASMIRMVLICLRRITVPFERADVAVLFRNALQDDGTPKPILAARLETALKCHRAGLCSLFPPSTSAARVREPWRNGLAGCVSA